MHHPAALEWNVGRDPRSVPRTPSSGSPGEASSSVQAATPMSSTSSGATGHVDAGGIGSAGHADNSEISREG